MTATSPLAYIAVYRNTDLVNPVTYRYYFESYAMPIKVEEADYNANDVFTLKIKYLWFGSPEPDYTVKVYSKQDLAVRNSDGQQNVVHMDGQCPSGFTDSTYEGMDGNSCGNSGGGTDGGGTDGGGTDGGGIDGGGGTIDGGD
jgi:uncharacterized membrane protein YgcG